MKLSILCLLMVFSVNSFASSDEVKEAVPKRLKGGKITITLPNGEKTVVSEDDFKVVPRKHKKVEEAPKPAPVVCAVCRVVPEPKPKKDYKNRLSLLGGVGPTGGLVVDPYSSNITVIRNKRDIVLGLQYQRKISDRLSLGIQEQTNYTCSLMVGLDF